MGEVYRARDATLNREVAQKVLPAAVATDPERLAQLVRRGQSLGPTEIDLKGVVRRLEFWML